MARSNLPEKVTMWRLTVHFRAVGDSSTWTVHGSDYAVLREHYNALLSMMQEHDPRATVPGYSIAKDFIYTVERPDGSVTAVDAREISRISLRSYETEKRFVDGGHA